MKFIYLMENEKSKSPPLKPNLKEHIKPYSPPHPSRPIKYIPRFDKGVRDYCKLLNLTREPFSMAPEPDFFYQSIQHRECLNHVEIGLRLNRGLQVILGSVGTGKTTISRLLLDRFTDHEGDFTLFFILNPTWRNNQEFLIHLKKMFNIKDESNLITDMMNQIEHFLIDYALKYNKRIVMIIDEGQKMGPNQLEIVRSLLNFETNSVKLIQFAIFAQPEFIDTLNIMENLKDRIAYISNIKNIDERDTKGLIDHRLKIAGLPDGGELFTENAKNLIHKYTNGFPRKIIITCHNLLVEMLMKGKLKVDSDLVFKFTQQNNLMYE
ncbi:ExeA family protein [Candidatus Neomarinimicrobiota bacterium]